MIPRLLHPDLTPGQRTLSAEASHHLVAVLRMRAGDRLTLFDGQGFEAGATVTHADRQVATVDVGEVQRVVRESPTHITVVQALCTGDKMDWVVQKATELGARRIIPVRAARSVLKLDANRAEKRVAHWRAIASAASAQCGRNALPNVTDVMSFTEVLADWAAQATPKTGWLLDPFTETSISQAPMSTRVAVMIGPEAGWTDEEESLAKRSGMTGVQVGPRILRTETVATVVLSAIAMKSGEF